jgi:homoserine/homoserine lactone efflux protein
MNTSLYFAFVLAAALLIAVPGPNIMLIVSNSFGHGKRLGFYTVLGTSVAMLIQLAVAVTGLMTAILFMSAWFEWLRWIGVAYLLYLGCRQWIGANGETGSAMTTSSARLGFWQGFLVSLTNPKTMLFFAAFLPQFADAGLPITSQLILLAATFWCMAIAIDSAYMLLASRLKPFLDVENSARLRGRITGFFLMAGGVGLALARRS